MRIDANMEVAQQRNSDSGKTLGQVGSNGPLGRPGNQTKPIQHNNNNNNNSNHTNHCSGFANQAPKAIKLQDKNLQELRAFALEYVKQIVAKANELSQERQESRKVAQIYLAGSQLQQQPARKEASDGDESLASKSRLVGPHERVAFSEAAVQINNRFQLVAPLQTTPSSSYTCRAVAKPAGSGSFARPEPMLEQQIERLEASLAAEHLNRETSTTTKVATPAAAAAANKTRRASSVSNDTANNHHLGQQRRPDKREKRGLHHRLNWHLLVSCFSTCLPQNLADTIPSGMHSSKVDPEAL